MKLKFVKFLYNYTHLCIQSYILCNITYFRSVQFNHTYFKSVQFNHASLLITKRSILFLQLSTKIQKAMSFIGTQQKCKVCEKTVYPIKQLSAEGIVYHKSCFKCSHLKKCASCSKIVCPSEKAAMESQAHHKTCFKCSHGGYSISPSNYAALQGIWYCKHHFSKLFKEKDSYNHLIKFASMKRAVASVPKAWTCYPIFYRSYLVWVFFDLRVCFLFWSLLLFLWGTKRERQH